MKWAFVAFVPLFAACGSGPKIPICVYSVDRIEFDCVDRQGKAYVCDGHDKACDKMIGTTPDGYRQLLQFAKDHNIPTK